MGMTNTGSALVVLPISRRRSVRGRVHLTQASNLNQSSKLSQATGLTSENKHF
jgi:hypothetical protein